MRHLPIGRALTLALVALTLVFAVIAALGIASLYAARQNYENEISSTSSLSIAAANLASAGIVEEEVLRDARGPAAASERVGAQASYRANATFAKRLAAGDPPSARLVAAEIAAQSQARALANSGRFAVANAPNGPLARTRQLAAQIQKRQRARQGAARAKARSDSRRALILIVAACVLALLAALALIAMIVRGLRRPLQELVAATSDLAAGKLDRRVRPTGPSELVGLGSAFNAMAERLATAQRRIEEERQRLAVTIASLGDALIVTDTDGVTIRTINRRATQLVPELVVGGRGDAPDSPLPKLAEALASEAVIEHRERTLAVTAAALAGNGERARDTGYVWTIRDTTERARLERAKSEFVATASHELRSPLTSIKGFVELLQRSPGPMTARQREFVQIIMRSTDRLVDLVNDLLDVARIEADHVEVHLRAIDVSEPVREVVELMGPRIADKRQELSTFIEPNLPPAYADPGRVRQIVANVITNAHIYTPAEGKIDVWVRRAEETIQITVVDTGIGMTREQVEHVFDRFYRASGQTTPGTGLGLSIVKSLVDMHQGQVEVESEPGRGTTISVRLPVAAAEPEPAEVLSPEEIRGRRVLIVDDERDIAELIARQLTPLDVRPTIVTNGREALEKLRTGDYDAVTLDVLMPAMDGLETLRQIRSDPQLRSTPVVFVSVFSHRRELVSERVVSKPIDADELRRVVGGAVRAGRSSVLVVGREQLRGVLEPALEELGIDHFWELDGAESVARVCAERRFEVAVVDAGLPDPQAVLDALDLRGRRLRQAVIMFSDGDAPALPGVSRLGMEVVPVKAAADALIAVLEGKAR
jgi:signal transduction histidine kinase/DNA-binding response OmpR family regulator